MEPEPHTQVEVATLPKCDFCSEKADVDGKTKMGPWANMCPLHFQMWGIKLGLGFGQRLLLRTT